MCNVGGFGINFFCVIFEFLHLAMGKSRLQLIVFVEIYNKLEDKILLYIIKVVCKS